MNRFFSGKYILEKLDYENELHRRVAYVRFYAYATLGAALFIFTVRTARGLPAGPGLFGLPLKPGDLMLILASLQVLFVWRFPKQWMINTVLALNLAAALTLVLHRGGGYSPFVVGIPTIVFLAGFLIRPYWSLIFSAISIIVYTVIVIGQTKGWLPLGFIYPDWETPYVSVLVVCSAYMVVAFTAWVFSAGFERRRRARERSEKQYRLLVDRLPDPVFLFDSGGNIKHVNPAGLDKFGYATEEIIGRFGMNLLPREIKLENFKKLRDDLQAGKTSSFETEMISKSGKRFQVEVNAGPIMEKGNVIGVLGIFREITERKHIENALRDSERFLSSVFSNIQDGLTVLDKNLNVLRTNPTVESWHPHAMPLVGKNCYTAFHSRTAPCEKCPSLEAMRTGGAAYCVVPKSGPGGVTIGWLDLYSFPLRDDSTGEIHGVIEYVRDISDRKNVEEALKRSEEQYRSLAEAARDLIFIVDRDINVRYVNSYAANQLGVNPEDVIGKSVEKFFPPQIFSRMKLNLLKVFETGENVTAENKIVYPKGENWIETKLVPLRKAGGEIDAVMGVSRDFTERKLAENALRDSELRYRSLIETSPDAIILTGIDSKVIMANRQAAKLIGYEDEKEIIGLNGMDFIVPEDHPRARQNVESTLSNPNIFKAEYRVIRKDGFHPLVEINSTILTDANGAPYAFMAIARDITKRRKAEEKLRESEEKYRGLIETSPDSIILIGLDLKILVANKQAAITFGLVNEEELIGMNAFNLLAPEDNARMLENIQKTLNQKDPTIAEYKFISKSGAYFFGEIHATVLRDTNGKPLSFLCIGRDITERRKSEAKLRESEERYRRLVEMSPDAITLTGLDLKVVMANRQAAILYGAENEKELIGLNSMDFIAPEERQLAGANALITLKEGHVASLEYHLLRKDGSTYPGELTASLLTDGAGNPIGFLGVLRDITERKQVEEKLRESEERFRTLADATQEIIVIHDGEKILDINQAATRLTGYQRSEFIGKKLFDFAPPEIREFAMKTDRAPTDAPFELWGRTKDGTRFDVEVSLRQMQYMGVKAKVATVRDITEQKRAEVERKRLEEQLILADRMASLGQLVLGIAHEFNNVLGGLRGYAQLSQMPGKENRLRELPDMVIEMVDRAQGITENLLDFSERFHPTTGVIRPSELIQSILKLMRKDLENSHIQVKMNVPGDFAIKTDGAKLQQVLVNIVINARQAMPQGGDLSFDLKEKEGKIYLRVSDTGHGIPRESLPRIFDPFFTTKGPLGGGSVPGAGLGLSLSYGIMRSLGGAIEVESEVGQGSAFSIVLPRGDDKV